MKSKSGGSKGNKTLIETLHPLETKVLPKLSRFSSVPKLVKETGLKEVEVMRALQWLENKGIVKIKKKTCEVIDLDSNGMRYQKKGLPETRLLKNLTDKWVDLDNLMKTSQVNADEKNICLGALRSKAAIEVKKKDNNLLIKKTKAGDVLLKRGLLEEKFLKKGFPIDKTSLSDEDKFSYSTLLKRKQIIKKTIIKQRDAELTELGKKLAKSKIEVGLDRITPQMLKSGQWKNKRFRRYDVKINVPKIMGGKKHPYNEFLDEARRVLIKMGFVEMDGPIIETEFWNFDALFQPQNHPARTWSASYSIKSPKHGDLPSKKIVDNVKKTHEDGGTTGSTGWGYRWDPKIASQLVPRAHDTAISPRYMAKDLKIPGKYFSLVRCYRPDVIDATHGVEFNQMGGIVVGEELSFKHLLGLLKDTAIELTGATEVKFFPDYFPFTEPSVQISVKHPDFGWMELAGAGVFRPELCKPLGIDVPVIAWGFGIDRLAMLKLGIKDIRDLFTHDLEKLRNSKKVY